MRTPQCYRQPDGELPGMLATLCAYESWLGPHHPHTLLLLTEAADACRLAGEYGCARPLLERAVRDTARFPGPDHNLRIRAVTALRDLMTTEGDYERAAALQSELARCEKQAGLVQ